MKVKVLVVTVVLAAAFLLSCTTTTDTNGDGGVTEWAFDWAYQIAKSYAENRWDEWDEYTKLVVYDCVLADEKCMLGRPQAYSFWEIWYMHYDDLFSIEVDEDGEADGEEHDESSIDYDEIPAFSNSKLEEMMAFCIDEDNDLFDHWGADPNEFKWFVEVSCDYNELWSGVDNIFRVWFFESRGDIDDWDWKGFICIDCDGEGNDYEILYWEYRDFNIDVPRIEAPQSMPLSRMLAR